MRVPGFVASFVAALASACTLSNAQPEMLLAADEAREDAGRSDASTELNDPPRSGSSGVENPRDASAPAAASGSGGTAGGAVTRPSRGAGGAGSGAPSGGSSGGFAGNPEEIDAGTSTDAALPSDPISQAAEDYLCLLTWSGCFIDPFNIDPCLAMHEKECDFPDAGPPPSPACAQELADCVMRTPDRSQECTMMLATCMS